MTNWAVADIGEAATLLRSSKLLALSAARAAGVTLPQSIVLLRTGNFYPSDAVELPDDCIGALTEAGDGYLVLRAVHGATSSKWRAVVVPQRNLAVATQTLLSRQPDVRAILLQARWTGSPHREAVVVTMAATLDVATHASGYVWRRPGEAAVLDAADERWGPVIAASSTLERTMGACPETVLGLAGDDVTVLSIRRGTTPSGHASAMAERAAKVPGLRMNAIAATAELLEAGAPTFDLVGDPEQIAKLSGRSVGGAWAAGRLSLSPRSQADLVGRGEPVILAREVLRAEDCELFRTAAGVVSAADGVSSHYAMLAGSLQKPCLVDLAGAIIDATAGVLRVGAVAVYEGDWVTVDERSGALLVGRAVPAADRFDVPPSVLAWAHHMRRHRLLVNCEDSEAATAALAMGADGVGLCRSERHVVSSGAALAALRQIVHLPDDSAEALQILGAELERALEALLEAAAGKPVNYRLLEPAEVLLTDVPVHSVPPNALSAGMLRGEVFRGRFATLMRAQIACAVRAAVAVADRARLVDLVIIVPMVSDVQEFQIWERYIRAQAANVSTRAKIRVGVMVETPRAALLAGELAKHADILLVGTNDLTSLVWGLERSGALISIAGTSDPFERFDVAGVGELMRGAIRDAHAANDAIGITVCGSHASVPDDVCQIMETGPDGLSCQLGALPQIALQLALHGATVDGCRPLGLPLDSCARQVFSRTLKEAMQAPDASAALGVLAAWASDIAMELGFEWTGVWKFFKRDLVAAWFGLREARRFLPGWRADNLFAYAVSLQQQQRDARIRYSVFPSDIACRAHSELLPLPMSAEVWRSTIASLDPAVAVEVFAQQSTDRWAFRAVLSGHNLTVEGAPGAAIDIFWKSPRELKKFSFDGATRTVSGAERGDFFERLFEAWLVGLSTSMQAMRDFLGADWVSLEGYAGPSPLDPLFIADVDLSLDCALLGPSPATLGRLRA